MMPLRWVTAVALLVALQPSPGQGVDQPDAVNLSSSTMESPYFKFHYSFPQTLSPQNDELRLEKNRKRHEDAVKRADTDASRTVNARGITTTTKIFWTYDLLFATPPTAEGKPSVPYVRVWAMECSNVTNQPGDYAKLLHRVPSFTELGKTEAITIAGHKFMRSSFLFEGEHFPEKQFDTLYETLSGKFLLIFEFHGKTEQETNELAKTMESLKFDR